MLSLGGYSYEGFGTVSQPSSSTIGHFVAKNRGGSSSWAVGKHTEVAANSGGAQGVLLDLDTPAFDPRYTAVRVGPCGNIRLLDTGVGSTLYYGAGRSDVEGSPTPPERRGADVIREDSHAR